MPRRKNIAGETTRDIALTWVRERPDLKSEDYLYLIYLMRLGRILERIDDRRCRQTYGISGPEMRVLLALRRSGAPFARRPTDLYRAALVTSGAITKQVDRLAARELVRRLPDPKNSGGFLIQLTDKGVGVADRSLTELAGGSPFAAGRNKLTRDERRRILALSERLLSELEHRIDDMEDASSERKPSL